MELAGVEMDVHIKSFFQLCHSPFRIAYSAIRIRTVNTLFSPWNRRSLILIFLPFPSPQV